jgi:hypothetical protein
MPGDVVMSAAPHTPQEAAAFDTSSPFGMAASAAKNAFQHIVVDPMQQEAELSRSLASEAKAKGQADAWGTGSHMANMHAIASGVPIVGPMAAQLVQRYLSGDRSGAVTELGGTIAAPEAMNEIMGRAALPKNPFRGTPEQALARTMNASGSVPFRESIEIAKGDLDRAAAQHPVKTIQDTQKGRQPRQQQHQRRV